MQLHWRGRVRTEIWDRNRCLERGAWRPNGITSAAINYVLNSAIKGSVAAISTWYLGLVSGSSFTGFSSSDTMSSHAGWSEATSYTEANRPTWAPVAATAGVLVTDGAVQFTSNDSQAILAGLFLASNNTKGGSSGTLFATALFDSNKIIQSGQVLKVFYEIELLGVS